MAPAAVAAFCIAYLVGSLPWGLIVARLAAGIDIRKHGSGNIGATNVSRVLGFKYGAIVLGLDCLKGLLPTALLPPLFSSPGDRLHFAVLAGLGAILGHVFPCWLGFRGGKGVATALGVALVLTPVVSAAALLVFLVCFGLTRIISISSILGACVFCGVQLWTMRPAPFSGSSWSLAAFSTLAPLLILVRHRDNIRRLTRGEEAKLRLAKPAEDGERPA